MVAAAMRAFVASPGFFVGFRGVNSLDCRQRLRIVFKPAFVFAVL